MYDIDYKKTLAKALNIDDLSLLDSVVGENEFKLLLARFNERNYSPGKRQSIDKIDNFDLSNLNDRTFCANLHVHTNVSDGVANIEQILNAAKTIADNNAKAGKFGFLLAITDHDAAENAQKALRIITENKKEFKNLKFAAGVEISTVGTEFSNQLKTLDIHTLLYCINPFEKTLTDFLENKMRLKFELATLTLNRLTQALCGDLKELGLDLTLEEAAKIHPMITKGQDEVSHPLKKYIFARTLFAYYVDKNPVITALLDSESVDKSLLSYEKPVFKYKSMFNNERYFYIYKDALEKYLNSITGCRFGIRLPEIPESLENSLLKAKKICEEAHPAMDRPIEAFSEFSKTLEFVNTLDFATLSIAHPARINTNYINSNLQTFFDELWKMYKFYGKDRAYAYEKYYQSYTGKKHFDRLAAIDETAAKYNLAFSGGIDSHGCGVCSRA